MFHKFDEATKELKIFKVQTIGDAYVIVSGLPAGYVEAIEDDDAKSGSIKQSKSSQSRYADTMIKMARIMYKVVSETQIIVDGQPHQLHMRDWYSHRFHYWRGHRH